MSIPKKIENNRNEAAVLILIDALYLCIYLLCIIQVKIVIVIVTVFMRF